MLKGMFNVNEDTSNTALSTLDDSSNGASDSHLYADWSNHGEDDNEDAILDRNNENGITGSFASAVSYLTSMARPSLMKSNSSSNVFANVSYDKKKGLDSRSEHTRSIGKAFSFSELTGSDDEKGRTKKKKSKRSSVKRSKTTDLGEMALAYEKSDSKKKKKDKDKKRDSTTSSKRDSTTSSKRNSPKSPKKTPKSKKKGSAKEKVDSDKAKSLAVFLDEDSSLDSFASEGVLSRSSRKSRRKSRSDDDSKKKKKKKSKSKSEILAAYEEEKKKAEALDKQLAEQIEKEKETQTEEKNEILRLQQELSEALHKVVATTAEQIQDKDNFLKLSNQMAELKEDMADIEKTRDEAEKKMFDLDASVGEKDERIEKLEAAIERQLDLQDALEVKLQRSEDEIDKLLKEIADLESGAPESAGAASRALKAELQRVKDLLSEKEKETEEAASRIEFLEKEVENGDKVNKLQVEEMDEEIKALQAKLKGARLEATSKYDEKDEKIAQLMKELAEYKVDEEALDYLHAKEILKEKEDEMKAAQTEALEQVAMVSSIQGEKEDLAERINVLNEQIQILQRNNKELETKYDKAHAQVLEWTSKTYDWKKRAEEAEKRLEGSTNDESESDNGSAAAAQQGSFLQAVMDKQEATKTRNSTGMALMRAMGIRAPGEENMTSEEIKIKRLGERNESLDAELTTLKQEIEKLKATTTEKIDSLDRQVVDLSSENEALKLKNSALEKLKTPNKVDLLKMQMALN